jgi:hypothetical protein
MFDIHNESANCIIRAVLLSTLWGSGDNYYKARHKIFDRGSDHDVCSPKSGHFKVDPNSKEHPYPCSKDTLK